MDNRVMISIIMPTYNRANTIQNAIYSILNQTYDNIELIIVDDGSTDNTKLVISSISDNRITYLYQDNSGACKARNNGISCAKGDYIAFADSDDVWRIDKLEKQMGIFKKYNPIFQFSNALVHDKVKEFKLLNIESGFYNKIDMTCIATPTIIAKKELFEKIRFDEELPRFQDFELGIRVMEDFEVFYLEDVLIDVYRSNISISASDYFYVRAVELILKKHKNFCYEYRNTALIFLFDIFEIASKHKNDKELKKECIDTIKLFKFGYIRDSITFGKKLLLHLNIYSFIKKIIKGA